MGREGGGGGGGGWWCAGGVLVVCWGCDGDIRSGFDIYIYISENVQMQFTNYIKKLKC